MVTVPVVAVERPVHITADSCRVPKRLASRVPSLVLCLAAGFSDRRTRFPKGVPNLSLEVRAGMR
jgi:hypothetical protein